jgi:hypothetical protein
MSYVADASGPSGCESVFVPPSPCPPSKSGCVQGAPSDRRFLHRHVGAGVGGVRAHTGTERSLSGLSHQEGAPSDQRFWGSAQHCACWWTGCRGGGTVSVFAPSPPLPLSCMRRCCLTQGPAQADVDAAVSLRQRNWDEFRTQLWNATLCYPQPLHTKDYAGAHG